MATDSQNLDSGSELPRLLCALSQGRLSRRNFMQAATALGLSAGTARLIASDSALAAPEALPGRQAATVGPAADRIIFSSFGVEQAPLEIQNDRMDLYIYGLRSAGAQALSEGVPGVRLIQAPASTLSLILNPAPAREGELNPFAVKEIRRAVQTLVDRDLIATSIYGGRAVPMFSQVSPLDYDALTVFATERTADLRFDPEFARTVITGQMQGLGATLENNAWTFQGRPVVLKIVTRVEDERRDIGDLFRAALEGIGFQVQPVYQPFGPATLAVYASDPQTFQWHAYTEGWGRGAPNRYDSDNINQFAAPWYGNMPGWQEVGYWQYQQPELDVLGQRLFRGQFASREERDDLYRQMTAVALDESVRIWVATALQSFPVREEVRDLTVDLVSGPKSLLALREARVEGSPEIRVGNLWVWTDRTTWNPVGGFGDVYSGDIYKNIVDPPLINHPFTGTPIPFRADFEPETAGPSGTLPVPEDALRWDVGAGAWAVVGSGVTAISKVTYDYTKYFQAPFHHGQPITPADLIYPIAAAFERAFDEEKIQIETALGVTARPYLETFKGIRLLEDNRLEVYVDFWHFDAAYIASYASLAGVSTPWELLAAMDEIVYVERRGAYTDTTAARFQVPWLSLVTETDARLIVRTLRRFAGDNLVPPGVFDLNGRILVTPEEATARYEAATAWFDRTNLLVISNGPFTLNAYDPPSQFAELLAFREEGYPFKPGDWLFGTPPTLTVDAAPPPPAILGEPLAIPVTVAGPGTLALSYILIDPAATGEAAVVASGQATGDAGNFTVEIGAEVTGGLFPSLYQLYLLASSNELAQVAERRVDLEVGV